MVSAREHSLNILDRFRKTDKQLKLVRESYFQQHQLTTRDRQRILVLTNEVIRWKGRLDLWIGMMLNKPIRKLQPDLLTALELAVYELMMDSEVPAYAAIDSAVMIARNRIGNHVTGLVNAVLRKLAEVDHQKQPADCETFEWLSVPGWLYRRWETQFGKEQTFALCQYFNSPALLTIRRNDLKVSHDELTKTLVSDGILLELIPDSDRFYHVLNGGHSLRRHPLFKSGGFSFQDRAAGAVVELLDPQPGEIVLDVCAAPGTKTLYIAERMKDVGNVLAYDSDPKRMETARNDMKRMAMKSINWTVKDATQDDYPEAERILIDVPCTGTGVISRRPDIKWRRRPEHIDEMAKLQFRILENTSRFLKPNGVLVYSTCSLEPEENWNIIEAFLETNSKFRVIGKFEMFPPRDHTDGIFAVKLKLKQ